MKKIITVLTLAGSIILGGTTSPLAHTAYHELEIEGVELKHFTVTDVSKSFYKAKASNGTTLLFGKNQTPDTLKKWNRVRAFYDDNELMSVEYVKPAIVEYKVTKITKHKGYTEYNGTSKKDGGIVFSTADIEGKAPKVGESVLAEFDMLYIENGLIKVYKKN